MAHQKPFLCQHIFSIFVTLLKSRAEYYRLSEIGIGFSRKICLRKQIFEQILSFEKILVELEVSKLFHSFLLNLFVFFV